MTSRDDLTVRLGQTVTPFGVGAIYDISGQSFVAEDIAKWGPAGRTIFLDRLAAKLRVEKFRVAPSVPSGDRERNGRGVPFFRFPRWMFCASCRRMIHLPFDYDERGTAPECDCAKSKKRRSRLIPMRFVGICKNGHMAEVAWVRWTHSQTTTHDQRQCQLRDLKFLTRTGSGGGLDSLVVKCKCDASRSLAGITESYSLRQIGVKCEGRQPWQPTTQDPCDEEVRVVPRGASNVHFSVVESALDIPPESDYAADEELRITVTSNQFYPTLSVEAIRMTVAGQIAVDARCEPETVIRIWREDQENSGKFTRSTNTDIELGEWNAFHSVRTNFDERDRFIAHPVDIGVWTQARNSTQLLSGTIDRVVQASRLREIRALRGFTRLEYMKSEDELILPGLNRPLDWLPAIEVFGEGVFIGFNEKKLSSWEADHWPREVSALAKTRVESESIKWLPAPTPRFLMLHTLSHMIIRRTAFAAGYSLSSIRERLYVRESENGEPMAGILIYTAAGDSEGSLGGLVNLGEPGQLSSLIETSLVEAIWCSQDPICSESSSGRGAINHAACHACSLLPETSCQFGNLLLDRRLVIGDGTSSKGFLESVALAAMNSFDGGKI